MTDRFIVTGAPCSGKSTFARESADPGDLIYDYDLIHGALSGQGDHDHLDSIRPYVIAARDAVFDQLESHKQQGAYIITSSPKVAEWEALSDRFDAEIVYLEVDLSEAHRRADLDGRPEIWHSYIENWFDSTDSSEFNRGEKMEKKSYIASMEFKESGDPGDFIATFATMEVIDHDDDVTRPGAFTNGQEVIIEPWNHGWDLPAGKGKIYADDQRAWIDGKFFIDTEVGRENYRTVKNMGDLAEWSYTFYILESSSGDFDEKPVRFLEKMDVVGVSPVTRGAGIDTGTESIKSADSETEGEAEIRKLNDQLRAEINIREISSIVQGVKNAKK